MLAWLIRLHLFIMAIPEKTIWPAWPPLHGIPHRTSSSTQITASSREQPVGTSISTVPGRMEPVTPQPRPTGADSPLFGASLTQLSRLDLDNICVSLPRPILPGSIYLLTRRCTQRQFLLKPTALTSQIFEYCLAVAAERTGVLVHAACVLSNHWHAVISDPHGQLPVFTAFLHKFVSKAVNASLGRRENLWASEQPSQLRLVGPEDVIARMIYTLANPVAAKLVARAGQWPGVWGYLPKHSKAVARPRIFFRNDGPMPAVATLSYVPPQLPGFSVDAVYGAVAAGVAACEVEVASALRRERRRVLGVKAVLTQDVYDSPKSAEERCGLSPRIAAKNKWARIEALGRLKAFVDHYRAAFRAWAAGARDTVFPAGTYALRIHACVSCAST